MRVTLKKASGANLCVLRASESALSAERFPQRAPSREKAQSTTETPHPGRAFTYKIFSRLTAKSRRKALGLGLFGNRRRDNFYEADTLPAGEGVGRPRAASKDARFVLPGRLKSAPRCCILPDPPLDGPLRTARTAGLAWSTNAASPVPQPWRKWSRAGPLVTAIPIALDRDPRRGRARHVGGRGVESLPLSKTVACEEEALAPDLSPFPNLT